MIPIPKHQQGCLFNNSRDDLQRGQRIACVGKNGGPYTHGQLARGYFAAAHQLLLWDVPRDEIETMSIEQRSTLRVSIDLKVYPILYCYRHGTELALKHLLFQFPRLFNQTPKPDQLEGHSLDKLWDKLLPHLVSLRNDASVLIANEAESQRILKEQLHPDVLDNVGSILREINGLDERSTTFRYALDRIGKVPLNDKYHIVLDKLFHFMLPVNVWFDEMIHRSDVLVGPPIGLEAKWLDFLGPPA